MTADLDYLPNVQRAGKEDRVRLLNAIKPRVAEGYTKHIPHPAQQLFLLQQSEEVLYGGAAGGGKSDALLMAALQYALGVDTPIPTPDGWTTIADVQIGDQVFDETGTPVKVIAKSPVFLGGDRYRITFDDGQTILADGDHLWAAETFADRMSMGRNLELPTRLVTTREMHRTRYTNHKRPQNNWSVRLAKPLDLPEQNLPIDPYVLGVWLGDGSKRDGTIAGIDREVQGEFVKLGYTITPYGEHQWHVKGLRTQLEQLGVRNNKHVPAPYLRGSKEQRLALLQGLMDTDGTVDSRWGVPRFANTDEALIDAVCELANSLGWKARRFADTYTTQKSQYKRTISVVTFIADEPVFRIPRKLQRQVLGRERPTARRQTHRMVVDVEQVPAEPVQCITVDGASHLYLAGRGMIPTHNCDVPGYSALLLRRTWPDLILPGAILDRAREWLQDTDAQRKEGGRIWVFPSGARITFGYLHRENDKYRYQCFTPDTDILTADGWKPVAEVKVGDPVATVSPDSGGLHYFQATRTWEYDYDGDMVDIYQKNGVSFTVTPNHTIHAGTERNPTLKPYRADELPYTATIPQTFDWHGVTPGNYIFEAGTRGGDLIFDATTWAQFLGWYIAEGNCGSYNGRWEVKISQVKQDGREALAQVIGQVKGANAHWTDRHVSLNNKRLVEHLLEHTETGDDKPKAHTKCLPEYVYRWDQRFAEQLLIALVQGDGTVRNHGERSAGSMVFVTYSERLADDVMRLAIHAGWRPTLLKHSGGNYKDNSVAYRVSLSKRVRQTATLGNQRTIPYRGKVHCVTVEPYHTLVIRHRGRVSLSGNSAEFQFIGFDELTQFSQSQYEYLFSRIRRPNLVCLRCRKSVRRYRSREAHYQWKHTNSENPCDDLYPDPKVLAQYPPTKDGLTLFDVPLRMRSASNPGGVGHAWVRDHFVDPVKKSPDALFIPATLADNPSLDQETYRKNLEHLSSIDRERLLNGDWDVSEEGAYFQRHWFTFLKEPPPPHRVKWLRYWDMAATTDGDWTAGCLMGLKDDGTWVIGDMRRMRGTPRDVERFIQATAMEDGVGTPIRMEQEPGSSGVMAIDYYRRKILVGYDFRPDKKTGSKETLAAPVSSAAEAGNIALVGGQWNREFLDEVSMFPNGAHDDQCLAGDTILHTPTGPKPISEVVAGDYVLGKTGWTRVLASGMTSAAAQTAERFGIRATASHPVWTTRGWVPFLEVTNDDTLSICAVNQTDATVMQLRAGSVCAVTNASGGYDRESNLNPGTSRVRSKVATTAGRSSRGTAASTMSGLPSMATLFTSPGQNKELSQWNPWSSTASPIGGIPIRRTPPTGGITNRAGNGSNRVSKPCTKRSGSTTTALSLTGATFTTKTATYPTTTLPIWNASKDVRTEPVYNITTADHTYYANGVLVHNCDAMSGAFHALTGKRARLLV